jgi:hypothetical protein
MANGDIAAAKGIPLVSPTGLVKNGYDEINRALDVIVLEDNKVKAAIVPVAKGGTGTDNVGQARINLEVPTDQTGSHLTFTTPGAGRLSYQGPDFAFPTRLANYDEIAHLQNVINALLARVAALESRP